MLTARNGWKPWVTWIVHVPLLKTLALDVETGKCFESFYTRSLPVLVLLLGRLSLLEFYILEWPNLGTAAGMIHSESVYGQGNLLDGNPSENFRGANSGRAHVSEHLPWSWVPVFVSPLLYAGAIGGWLGCGRWRGTAW